MTSYLLLLKSLKNIPCSVYWKDLDSIYLGCNEFMAKVSGLNSNEEIIGKTDYDLSWFESADSLRAIDQQVIKTGQPITIEETGKLCDGKLVTYLSTKMPFRNDKGEIIGIFGVSMDVSDHKHKEKILSAEKENAEAVNKARLEYIARLSQQVTGQVSVENNTAEEYAKNALTYLENIIACMPGNVYWMDTNCIYLGCNDNAAKLAGLKSGKDLVGKSYKDFASMANWKIGQAESFMKDDLEVMATGLPKYNIEELPLPGPDGNLIYYLTTRVPLKDTRGKVIGVVGVSVDISDRKRIEQELKQEKERAEVANKAKSNFLATMSHELRTPLNAIMGMAQILYTKKLTTEQWQEYLDVILLSGKNLLALINDILDFSKLEAGKLEICPKVFDLYALVEEVKVSMLHQVEDKGIRFLAEYDSKTPHQVVGDALRIRQVIINLVSNAIKFTEKGVIKITVRSKRFEEKTIFNIAIEDTGIGIPKDKIESIFERFTQVESTYNRRFGGVGLGLAICKQLVEAMGGDIHATSEYEKGSRFYFQIPLALPVSEKIINKLPDIKEMDISVLPKISANILIVEDNKLNQKIAKIMLEEIGCKVEIAANGIDAIELFKNNSYDLIFMDIGLPDMDGLQVIKKIRKLGKNKNHLPIIALTAHVLEEDRVNCLAAGANDILTKPIVQSELYSIVKKWTIEKTK